MVDLKGKWEAGIRRNSRPWGFGVKPHLSHFPLRWLAPSGVTYLSKVGDTHRGPRAFVPQRGAINLYTGKPFKCISLELLPNTVSLHTLAVVSATILLTPLPPNLQSPSLESARVDLSFNKTSPLRRENVMTRKHPMKPSTQLKLCCHWAEPHWLSIEKTSTPLKCMFGSGTINKSFSQKNNIYMTIRNRKGSPANARWW